MSRTKRPPEDCCIETADFQYTQPDAYEIVEREDARDKSRDYIAWCFANPKEELTGGGHCWNEEWRLDMSTGSDFLAVEPQWANRMRGHGPVLVAAHRHRYARKITRLLQPFSAEMVLALGSSLDRKKIIRTDESKAYLKFTEMLQMRRCGKLIGLDVYADMHIEAADERGEMELKAQDERNEILADMVRKGR